MSSEVGREAFVLPTVFLTVALAGGFRALPGGDIRFLPPPLVSLVLALFLVGVMVQGGLLVPARLMSETRGGLENCSGAVVIATLFFASAQVLNSLTPETGLLHLVFNLFFAALLWNTLAARPDRPRLLRSLLVVFGVALVFKYVLIAALYEPGGGLARRVAMLVFEGISLGTLQHQPAASATGYVAFFMVVLYVIGLILLPRDPPLSVTTLTSRPMDATLRRSEGGAPGSTGEGG